jgi:hypothetical protein
MPLSNITSINLSLQSQGAALVAKMINNLADASNASESVLVTAPNGYTGNGGTDYQIYRIGDRFISSANPTDFIFATSITYYLSPNGNDANSGLSSSVPKQSIRALIIALNTAEVESATFVLAPGEYGELIGWGRTLSSPNFDLVIKCDTGRAILSRGDQAFTSWTKTGGRTNVYQYTKATNGEPDCAYDVTNIDKFGHYVRLTPVANIGTVDSTPNSMFRNGTTIYVHTFDSRAADASVKILCNSINANCQTGINLYAKNIDFWGGNLGLGAFENSTVGLFDMTFVDCSFAYHSDENGLGLDRPTTGSKIRLFGCEAFYNFKDGLNYHSLSNDIAYDVLEVDCRAVNNGYQSTPADNGSTVHEAVRIVRLNGDYRENKARNVHDVDVSQSWNLGCNAQDPQLQTTVADSFNFGAGGTGTEDATLMWLDSCTSEGAEADIRGNGEATIKIRKFTGEGVYSLVDDATLGAY